MTTTFDMSECVLLYSTVFAGYGNAMYACCAFVLNV